LKRDPPAVCVGRQPAGQTPIDHLQPRIVGCRTFARQASRQIRPDGDFPIPALSYVHRFNLATLARLSKRTWSAVRLW